MNRLVQFITGRRSAWAVTIVSLLLGLSVLGVGQADREASIFDDLPAGFDSTQGEELLAELPDEGSATALVLFTRDDDGIEADLPALSEIIAGVDMPQNGSVEVGGEQGGPPGGMPLIPAEDGTAAFTVITLDATTAPETVAAVTQLRDEVRADLPEGVTAQVTGPAAIRADLASVFDGANFTLLLATASVVALLLLITYRSPWLWIVPLTVVGITDQVAAVAATHVLRLISVPWNESTIGILSVLVFGAGTNYALLLISRYRDELRTHESRRDAMQVAVRRAAEAIIASASTVALGVSCLLMSAFPATRGLGIACAVGILIAAAAVLLVLPAALVLFDRWIFWPMVPRVGQELLTETKSLWRRVGDRVAQAPIAANIGVLAFLMVLAAGMTQIESGLAPEDQFLETPEAITAGQRLAESFPAGTSDPVVVVSAVGDGEDVTETESLVAELTAVGGISSATALDTVAGVRQIQLVIEAESGSDEAAATVAAVRELTDGLPDTHVTGGEASLVDANDAHVRDRWYIMPLVLVAVGGTLMLLLRSILAPIILVSTVVATFVAALGVSWWLFTGLFGFNAIDPSMPLLAFLFLVALGIDYNIFLITRTLEESKGHGTREGVLRALGATGGVITSAGILLAAVFAVLGVLPLVVLAQVGVVICIGVLLDTLIVRTVLVPAIVRVIGEPFWWPRKVDPTGLSQTSKGPGIAVGS